MHWILAKIALFIAIIWAPTPAAVIPQNYPTDVGYKAAPHVIITAPMDTPDVQQKAENSPEVIVDTPKVILTAPEVVPNPPLVKPNQAFVQVAPTVVPLPQVTNPDPAGNYEAEMEEYGVPNYSTN